MNPVLKSKTILLERYEVMELIGEGGMQQVFKAYDHALDRIVALKTPLNSSAIQRFEQSARLSAGVAHPNVAHTLDYANVNNVEFLIEEFIEGENLDERLHREHDYLDPHLAAHIAHHVAKAVKALSDRNIIHRDLKPSNIMVSNDPAMSTVKVTDFGVAKLAEQEIKSVDPTKPSTVAASKTMVGALPYMAPELFRKNSSSDKSKADVWAVGALLYKFLFGTYPFPSEDLVDLMMAIASGRYTDQTSFIAARGSAFTSLLADLWKIIGECLVVDVTKRLDSTALAAKLEKLCYNSDPREFGTITYVYDGPKNIGTITSSAGREVFINFNDYYALEKAKWGDRVLFASYSGTPKDRAFPVLKCRSLDLELF